MTISYDNTQPLGVGSLMRVGDVELTKTVGSLGIGLVVGIAGYFVAKQTKWKRIAPEAGLVIGGLTMLLQSIF